VHVADVTPLKLLEHELKAANAKATGCSLRSHRWKSWRIGCLP